MDLTATAAFTTTASTTNKKSSSKIIKFEMKWTVDLDPGWLPDNRKTLQLCRESFSFLYGFSPNLIKKTSKKIKSIMSADLSSLKTEAQYNHRAILGTTLQLIISKPFLMQMDWSVITLRDVPHFCAHPTFILTQWFGWKSTSTNTNRSRMQRKLTSMQHLSDQSGKNTVKLRSHLQADSPR